MPTDYVVVEFRPMRAWPGAATPSGARASNKAFKVTSGATLAELEQELARHDAKGAFLEVAVRSPRDIRADGRLRADATVVSPGVVLYYTHPRAGDLRFACDRYSVWHHNVRGILLTLDALRSIDRYGAVRDGQQFTGFKALPGATALTMGTTAATRILTELSGLPNGSPAAEMYRAARSRTHPDRNNGERAAWDQVEAAGRVLGVANAEV